jgi:hypothetical protein
MPQKIAPPVKFKINKFNMQWIGADGDGKILIFLGKRKTGKSVLVIDYLWHNQDFPLGTVISPTDELNQTYVKHIPSIFIHSKFTDQLVEDFLVRQRKFVTKCKSDPNYKGVDPRAFLILDDCLYNASTWSHNEDISWIFMNGRHAQITLLLTAQYVFGIPPILRSNVDYIFICKEPKITNREKLHKHYAGMFPSFAFFNKVMAVCTKDYGCLVIDNGSTSDKIEDQVFHYRAQIHEENFRVCYDQFWVNNEAFKAAALQKADGSGRPEDESSEQDNEFEKFSNKKNPIKFEIEMGP